MKAAAPHPRLVAIACGGTGGHLFPGLAVGEALRQRGCAITLLISAKEVDQTGARAATGMRVQTLPAVALAGGNYFQFVRSFTQSYRLCRGLFRAQPPTAVLAMGGFTSAPPLLAGHRAHAKCFLHESNTIPGRANRLVARLVDRAFVGFPATATHLRADIIANTGTPVRPQFQPRPPGPCRTALGLDPRGPLLLVTGGSQGATGLNDLVLATLPKLAALAPELQYLHLTGPRDLERVRARYAELKLRATVRDFLVEMELALAAATAAVSRAGASSLAELAALRLPAVLVPYPTAADNHQFHNARAFERSGAALLLAQKSAAPEQLARLICRLIGGGSPREKMRAALGAWHKPHAAEFIADAMLAEVAAPQFTTARAVRAAGRGEP
jgi:UDP-N-acetylglucosamine--N-acetylmuramyl-(pentapeptide) pyrophosphoryl-undecaprenol N-acetylglucosamine transferase